MAVPARGREALRRAARRDCATGPEAEEPLDVARRELREEAELEAASWTHLSSTYPSPGISAEVHHLYLARDLGPASRGDFELHHEEADMTTGWVPFADLLRRGRWPAGSPTVRPPWRCSSPTAG